MGEEKFKEKRMREEPEDGSTQTSVESSQMSSERGTAEVTSAGETIQGEQQAPMLMGQGTHESTSQSQQVEEQPSALSQDQAECSSGVHQEVTLPCDETVSQIRPENILIKT